MPLFVIVSSGSSITPWVLSLITPAVPVPMYCGLSKICVLISAAQRILALVPGSGTSSLFPFTVKHLVHPHPEAPSCWDRFSPPYTGPGLPWHIPRKALPATGVAQRKAIRHMLPALKHIEDLQARPIRIDFRHMHGVPVPQL